MHKTILVATDGSSQAQKAIEPGCGLAGQDDARLGFLHVLLRDKLPSELKRLPAAIGLGEALAGELAKAETRKPTAALPAWASVMDPASVPSPVPDQDLNAIGRRILDAAAATAKQLGVQDCALELEDGNPVQCILEVAKRHGVDAIVKGHRGLRDIDALTLGSISNELSRVASRDVIMIQAVPDPYFQP